MFSLMGDVWVEYEFSVQLGGRLEAVYVSERKGGASLVVRVPSTCAGQAIKVALRLPEAGVSYGIVPIGGGRTIGQEEPESALREFKCYRDGSPILLGENGTSLDVNFNFVDRKTDKVVWRFFVTFEVGDVEPSQLDAHGAKYKPAAQPSRSRRPALRRAKG